MAGWLLLLTVIRVVHVHCELEHPSTTTISDGYFIPEPPNEDANLQPKGQKPSISVENADVTTTEASDDPIQYQPSTSEGNNHLIGTGVILQKLRPFDYKERSSPGSRFSNEDVIGAKITSKIDDCSLSDFEICGYGTCMLVTSGEGITCICYKGWTTNGTSVACLTDVNECKSHQGPLCSINPKVECINVPGSFGCGQCPSGYEGDGVTCTRTFRNLCDINHGDCHQSAQCTQLSTTTGVKVQCVCPEGMESNGLGVTGCYVSVANTTVRATYPCNSYGECHGIGPFDSIRYQGYDGLHYIIPVEYCLDTNPGFQCECPSRHTEYPCQVTLKPCGGFFYVNEGNIVFPMVNTITCDNNGQWLWRIQTGGMLYVTFSKFVVPECSSAFLELYDGIRTSSRLIGRFCGNKLPKDIVSRYGTLYVLFQSDVADPKAEFTLHWTSRRVKHRFVKPYPIVCKWTITEYPGDQYHYNITFFDVENRARQQMHYFEISSGADKSPLICKYCSVLEKRNSTSLTNILHINFYQQSLYEQMRFNIQWDGTIIACEGTSTGSSGSITSPNCLNNYQHNAECFYKIVTNEGSRINISFTELDLERSLNCRNHYIEIYDGRNTNAPTLGKYCNKLILASVETTTNHAFVKFRSGFNNSGRGFLLNYNTICHNNLKGQYGVIESPNYPHYYPINLTCLWNIQVPKGNRINITFTHIDIFQPSNRTEYYNRSGRSFDHNSGHFVEPCLQNYLQTKEHSEQMFSKKICGNTLPNAITTESNSFDIKFVTGPHAHLHTGFRLEWVSYGCGGHIYREVGSISLGTSETTKREMECEWIIEMPPGKSISIRFSDVYMFESPNCTADAIEIYNGQDTKAPFLAKICYQQYATIESDSNFMLIRFIKTSNFKDIHFTSQFNSEKSKCGGRIKSKFGFLYSKNYPKNYYNNLDCFWYIIVPEHHRIEINFIDVDLYSDPNVAIGGTDDCGDSILIYDESDQYNLSSNYTHRICSNSNKTQIISKFHYIIVRFKSDNEGTAKGFKANFSVTCGAVITATQDGIITNEKYINHLNKPCIWTIVAPKIDEKISLTFTAMSLPKDAGVITNRNCSASFLRVLDGKDNSASLIGEYCGRRVPPLLVSHGNAISIELGSYSDRMDGRFSVQYSRRLNQCGGILPADEGTIASPLYPSPYPVDTYCEWLINTPPGHTALVTFEEFDLEESEGCNEDYLELRENSGAGKLLALYCGSDTPPSIKAASIYIKFFSNSRTRRRGFLLYYRYLREHDIQGDNGVITSPLKSILYQGADEYHWRISTTSTDPITIIINYLYIPSCGDDMNNRLTIYKGYNNTAPILVQLDGAIRERKIIKAFSNVVYLLLTLDESNTGTIFHLSWTKTWENHKSSLVDQLIYCGSNQTETVLSGQKVILKSPNYPGFYANYLNCEWRYQTQMGRHLSITFTDFNLQQSPECNADYVAIYSAALSGDWKNTTKACTLTEVNNTINTSIYMKINLITDANITKTGFIARVSSECGGVVTDLFGEVGPTWFDGYTSYKRPKVNCNWVIKVRPGRAIKVWFTQFNITNSHNDSKTSVALFSGDSKEAPLLAYYENECKYDVVTSSNVMFVNYTSEHFGHDTIFQSFRMYYQELECGMTIELTPDHSSATIHSPNYPAPPNPYSEYVWIVTGPPGEILRIDFIDVFDIYNSNDCIKEFIEIRDGSSTLSPSKGRYCGNKPATIKTSSNTAYVRYSSELAEPRNGFKVNISIDVCGAYINADSGVLTSPGYPRMQVFPYGTVCDWHITGPPNHVFLIKPQDIHLLQGKSNCTSKIEIIETTPSNDHITLNTICGADFEEDHKMIETLSSSFIIRLTFGKLTEGQILSENRGFQISFKSSLPQCGGKITASEGYITSPSYPREITLRSCRWFIKVPNNSRRIRLELIDNSPVQQTITVNTDDTFQDSIEMIPSDTNIYESMRNTLAISVNLKPSGKSHRFKAKFTSDEPALCGGDLSDLNQDIVSPDLQCAYFCEWHYNSRVTSPNQNDLTYNSMSIYVNISVSRMIYRGYDPKIIINSPVYSGLKFNRQFRGNIRGTYRIPTTILGITAAKNQVQSLNFHMHLKLQPCGGFVQLGSNPINIINTPNSYNDTLDCAWFFFVPRNYRVEITMEGSFLLECDDEFVKISDDLNVGEIDTYCKGKLMASPLVIHFGYLYIQYHSDLKSNTSIKLMAKTVNDQCGGLAKYNLDGTFTSPNYPKPYIANQVCAWEINADLGYRISLQFIERFVIEDTANCTKDVVIIYDWKDEVYEEMARVCGRETSGPYISTYNRMKVVLRTDNDTNLDGFRAQWTPICGGKYVATNTEQMIYSPSKLYPYNYYMHCLYEISSANNQKISLKFLKFKLEDVEECISGNLIVTAQNYNSSQQVFCGRKLAAVIANYHKITLKFKADNYLQEKGFILSYSTNK